jgi:hypothetical protein
MSTTSVPILRDDLPENPTGEEKFVVVGFDTADDPWDPKNFPKWKKWAILFAVAHGALIVTCASSLYVSLQAKPGDLCG